KTTYIFLILLTIALIACGTNNDINSTKNKAENSLQENTDTIPDIEEIKVAKVKPKNTLIKNTQKRIKTDCFYKLGKYTIYFSQFEVEKYCDNMLRQSPADSLFYTQLKSNCIKNQYKDDNSFALELLLNQDIKIRNLKTEEWASSIEMTHFQDDKWTVNAYFDSDTITLMDKEQKHNIVQD
ncbi:MAG: hypothetical protein ACPG5P_04485, partial [Saprospiraceae bacterium]